MPVLRLAARVLVPAVPPLPAAAATAGGRWPAMITGFLAAPPHVPANWPGWVVLAVIALLILGGLGKWLKS